MTTVPWFPYDIRHAMSTCALRFMGYEYEEVSGLFEPDPDSIGIGLNKLMEPIVGTLILHADDNMNFAAFFGLQRWLHKWGGEFLTKYSADHIAYDFLFLHLYQRDVPDRFRNEEYCTEWQREYAGRMEEIASYVRNTFRRKGRGSEINLATEGKDQGQQETPAMQVQTGKMKDYKEDLFNRYWAYQERFFPQAKEYFEKSQAPNGRPPVFLPRQAGHNVITNPDAARDGICQLLHLLPPGERHRWFRSMNSSQALAQSVLGNLALHQHLDCLAELDDDEGQPLFGKADLSPDNFVMEHKINYLAEPRRTSLDGFVSGPYQVAVECKFTEADFGHCSRPALKPTASNYDTDLCDGTYARQRGRRERCSLTEIGVLYWKYVPQLFEWHNDAYLSPCPLHENYQLVRDVLAACVRSNGTVAPENGHVVVIYDERNPAFQPEGAALAAYNETDDALRVFGLLRKCSWQRIVRHLNEGGVLPWLTEGLELKYGLR